MSPRPDATTQGSGAQMTWRIERQRRDTNQSFQTRDPPPNLGTVHQCPDLVCLGKTWLTSGAGVALLLLKGANHTGSEHTGSIERTHSCTMGSALYSLSQAQ